MSGRQGGKLKPLKKPKKVQGDEDEVNRKQTVFFSLFLITFSIDVGGHCLQEEEDGRSQEVKGNAN